MNISNAKDHSGQLTLIEVPEDRMLTMAACRNFVGDFWEEVTCNILGGCRGKTDSTKDYCPDLRIHERLFVEVKSVGLSGTAIVYERRLDKDLTFCRENGVELIYCFWRHSAAFSDDIMLGELRDRAAGAVRSCIFIPLTVLEPLLRERPIKCLNTAKLRGYGGPNYIDGWQLRMTAIEEAAPQVIRPMFWVPSAYGRVIERPFDLHIAPGAHHLIGW